MFRTVFSGDAHGGDAAAFEALTAAKPAAKDAFVEAVEHLLTASELLYAVLADDDRRAFEAAWRSAEEAVWAVNDDSNLGSSRALLDMKAEGEA